MAYINQIKPYNSPGAVKPEEDMKPGEVKEEEDIKPAVTGKAAKVKPETLAKNNALNKWLIEYFTSGPTLRQTVVDLRETSATSKEPRSIKRTVGWITEMAYLKKQHSTVDYKMPDAPKELQGLPIYKGNWEVVVGRSPTYYKKAIDTEKFLETCKTEADIEKFIDDDKTTISVVDLMAQLKKKAWSTAGGQVAAN